MTPQGWVGLAVLLWFPAAFAFSAARVQRSAGLRDRCHVLSGAGSALLGLAIGRVLVPWDAIPPLVWGVAAAVAGWGAVTATLAWPRLPITAGRRPRLRLTSTAVGLAVTAAVVALLA